MTRTGLDRIARGDEDALAQVRGRRIGLVAHPASVDRSLRHAAHVLRDAGARIAAYFGPEHGYGGEAQDMIGVGHACADDGAPIHTLYGDSFASLSPTAEQLDGLDALVIDLQDVGSRYYTFVWTAALCLEAASARGVPTVILDRPNPLGGVRMEGAPQVSDRFLSFVGLHRVPVRHAMTIGEIVEMVRTIRGIDRDALSVVRMGGWDPASGWDATGLPWVLPSPNMPTVDTARVYPGGCLIEGTHLSEGRGCTRPFEIFGAPWLDGRRLSTLELEGAALRPLTFRPTFHKHAGQNCGGVQVHVTDEARFEPYGAYVRILAAIAAAHRDDFAWRTERYEFVDDPPAFDLLTGSSELRHAIDRGDDVAPILASGRAEVERFDEARRAWLLYPR